MGYFTTEHIRRALDYLPDHTHPALVSFLAMLRAKIPADDNAAGMPFGSEQEHDLLKTYFSPPGGTEARPFYVPFDKSKERISRWKVRNYGGTGLQRMREDRDWIFRRDTDEKGALRGFALRPNLKAIPASQYKKVVGTIPLSVHHLAVWLYRTNPFDNQQEAIDRFVTEFNLGDYDLENTVFGTKLDPLLSQVPLADEPMSADQLESLLEPQLEEGSTAGQEEGEEGSEEPIAGGSWDCSLDALDEAIADLKGVRPAAIQALAALRAGMHVVFTGPPGAGKTQLATRICKAATAEPWLVTATDAWTTFETIGGYFPQGTDGHLDFEPGVIVSAMQRGRVLIIDEINRADIDKAFGELFTLLAGGDVDLPFRRRGTQEGAGKRVRLASTQTKPPADTETIHMPDWWRIIGAMNDSDKASLKRLSFAFMRRFAFVPVGLPSAEEYSALIDAAAGPSLSGTKPKFVQAIRELFAAPSGFASLGQPIGFAIPKAMLAQAIAEVGLEASRTEEALLASTLSLYVAPQLQGRSDLHKGVLDLVRPHLGDDHTAIFEGALKNWTGYVD